MQVLRILPLLFICTIYSGCSSTQQNKKEEEQAALTVKQQLQSLGRDLDMARDQQIDILSPHHFKSANDFFIQAQKEIEKDSADPKTQSLIQHNLTSAQTYFHLAEEAAKKKSDNFEDILLARQMALNAGSQVYFANSFERADNVLRKMAAGPDPKLNSLKRRSSLEGIYKKFEVEALRKKHLDDARKNLEMAIKEGARKIAPLSLSSAIREYQKSANYIKLHPHDDEQIETLAQAVNQSAYLVLQMTRESLTNRPSSTDEVSIRQSAVKKRK